MSDLVYDVLVLGAGPGGYAAAIRAGQLGLRTVVVESAQLGGTCLNVGCIPSKALIHAADTFAAAVRSAAGNDPTGIRVGAPTIDLAATVAWKNKAVRRLSSGIGALLAKAGVTTVTGWGRLLDGKTVEVVSDSRDAPRLLRAYNVILATGSRPVELPALPFGGPVATSTDALAWCDLPEHLVVVGGGYIGLELGTAFAKLGAAVTIIETTDRLLPSFDASLVRPVERGLSQLGCTILTGAIVTGHSTGTVHTRSADGTPGQVTADRILVTVGRSPVVEGWGLDDLDLVRDGPFVRIDDRCRTSMTGIYAVGDLTGDPMLAHRAIAQGRLAAEVIAGQPRRWDKVCIPEVVFTDPELVRVGTTPDQARQAGIDTTEASFPYTANGRASTTADPSGFVHVVARRDDHVLLGVQGVGAQMSELSATFGLALEMGARLEDLADTIVAHPTRAEAFSEAAMAALGAPMHI
ncbi:MAG: dihydrolipoyl dehydrogenase [Actinomycetota bacterium]|jgi:dihydrolipoamide dehydrogenase|nr:dihydrolipoyl dehydrogenase [Actinomycetota bacterium]